MFKKQLTRIFNSFSSGTIVLCYHRITTKDLDPWELAVTPENFEEQLQMLKERYKVIPVDRLFDKKTQKSKAKSICITFDDGYTDNYTVAKPMLEGHGLPACFFISSGYTGKRQLFWWDELTAIILGSEVLPPAFALIVGNKNLTFDFSACTVLGHDEKNQLRSWRAKDKPVSKRCEPYLQLWETIRSLNADEIATVMRVLRDWSGFVLDEKTPDKFPMTEDQLTDLSRNSLFTIGLHTANHLALDFQSFSTQEEELVKNKAGLRRITQKEADIISFPYGRYNEDTLKLVTHHNIAASFTSEKKVVNKTSLPNRIGRFAVGNWSGAKLEKKLSKWFEAR